MKYNNWIMGVMLLICTIGLLISLHFFGSVIPYSIMCILIVVAITIFINPKLILFYLILLNERFFYLVDYSGKTIIDAMLILIILLYIYFGKEILKYDYRFKFEIIVILFIVIIGMFVTNIINNQPLTLAYHASKFMLLYALYFPMMIYVERYGVYYVLKVINIIGTSLAAAFLIQKYVLYPHLIFHVEYMDRFDSVRFFTGMSIIVFSSFISLAYLVTRKYSKKSLIYLVTFFIQVAHLLLVAQTRSLTIVLLIIYGGVILFLIQGKLIIKLGSSLILLILSAVVFGSTIGDIYSSVVDEFDAYQSGNGTLYVRYLEFKFVLSSIKENWAIGVGFYSGHFSDSAVITGTQLKYYLSDIGVFGFIFYMGILGLLVTIKYLIKLFKNSINAYKVKRDLAIIALVFTIYITLISPFNYIFNIEVQIIYLIIFTCVIEISSQKIKLSNYIDKNSLKS